MSGGTHEIAKKRKNDKWDNFCVRECRTLYEEELRLRLPSYPKGIGLQGMWARGEQISDTLEQEVPTRGSSKVFAYAHNFRLWQPFTSEKEKSEWWAEATSGFRDWWEVESTICRVDDGLPKGLDKIRATRIKQLGNSIVPPIVKLIGERIKHHETNF